MYGTGTTKCIKCTVQGRQSASSARYRDNKAYKVYGTGTTKCIKFTVQEQQSV